MRSHKRYTNQTFTKRVDHEAGRHHAPAAMPEPAVCTVCGDVYADRRWSQPDAERQSAKHPEFRPAHEVVCPACKRRQSGVPSGYVHLGGAFLTAHRDEIERLLDNEAGRAAEDNPLARIMDWKKEKAGKLTVTTTTEHLAQRLGHALEKAFDGEVRYDFSHENKLAHVWWQRD
ncbi:MAG TPA: BCAM0308 family protein [Blastocatellia bacterium]|nr:BCAM0308 family protein [Blastocatellia bacterium]